MRFFSRDKPKIKEETTKSEGFNGWQKCLHCLEMIHCNELEKNLNCCPKCDHHYKLSVQDRLKLLVDDQTFTAMFEEYHSTDALEFVDSEPYHEKLKKTQAKAKVTDAILTGKGFINGQMAAIGILDFNFMAGSMGSVVGEKLTLLIEYAAKKKVPLVVVSASGGARMQESIFSLMQMAKTSAALAKLHEAKIPFISILTNPTSGGVTASFASLGDIIIAEPDALICFAGPRVVEQVIRQKLPPGAQKSEFLLKHGMIDCIVNRFELKKKLSFFLEFLCNNERQYLS